jgi:acyl-CoA dehydrogenase
MKTFEASRPSVAAMAVGVARAATEFATEYARTRVQFGRPLGQNRGVAFQLADMAASVDAARLLTWRAAWMTRAGKPFERAKGSMSKLVAGETAVRVTEHAIQILGGNGYTREYPVERWHRDAKIFTIFEGHVRDPADAHRKDRHRAGRSVACSVPVPSERSVLAAT